MKSYTNDDWEYAGTRLLQTIVCKTDGTPAEILEVNPGGVVYKDLINNTVNTCRLADLDVTSPKLGYINHQSVASYLVRTPMRGDYRQGIRYGNIKTTYGWHATALPYSVIAKCIVDDYPTLESTIKKTGIHSQAWHRHWAVDSKLNLLYKGLDLAGSIVEGRPVLKDNYRYLQEALDDAVTENNERAKHRRQSHAAA